jgi:SPP1 gp7 family putative phage head morphogenesis protein
MAIDFPPDDLRGRELTLIIERAKYERGLLNSVDQLLDREFSRVVDLLLSPKYRTLTQFQQQRAQQLFREIGARLGAGYQDVVTLVNKEMQGYAQLEAQVARVQATSVLAAGGGQVSISLGVTLPRAYLESIAKLPIQGLRISDWFEGQATSMTMNAKRIIQQGLVEGKGPADIARRILAPDRAMGPKLSPALSKRAKAEARAITRTTINAVQNDAAMASYERLPDSVSNSYRWLSVRDNRTSIVCVALDGRVWRYDDPDRRTPPAHISCRSTIMPIIRGAEQTIASQTSGPMSFASYGDWLKDQPITTQNEILGVTRAGYWRDGKLSLADAIDQDTRVLTLAQLRETLGLGAVSTK